MKNSVASIVDKALAAGPAGLRRAQRTALRYAKRYLEDAGDSWKLETEWLKSLDAVHRACARYALVWRPRFLAALSMCHSPELAARHTRISCQTAYYHRKHDPEFAKQWEEAREYGIEMLHARAFQRAVEGDLEPIIYRGVTVGWVRRFDSRLQIEMLRAHRLQEFKTPGVSVNLAVRGDAFVLSESQRHELMAINRQWLLDNPPPVEATDHNPLRYPAKRKRVDALLTHSTHHERPARGTRWAGARAIGARGARARGGRRAKNSFGLGH
jgi:hypothetical protein